MIDITILKNIFTEYYFSKYLFMASCIYGIFRLIGKLTLNK